MTTTVAPIPTADASVSLRRSLAVAASLVLLATHALAARSDRYRDHAPAMAFAQQWATDNQQPVDEIQAVVGKAKRLKRVIKLVSPAPKTFQKDWFSYRQRFVEPIRIKAGQRFWARNRATLKLAEAQFGVPAWLVVGVIGVETLYGRYAGKVPTLDALATLAFDFPESHPRAAARSAFFRDELGHFLTLSRSSSTPIEAWRGSYAGALGIPQFMPSSWKKYAIDFDGDGIVDLKNSEADAIGSVANYFAEFGWQRDMPTHFPVTLKAKGRPLKQLLEPDIIPSFQPSEMHALGGQLGAKAKQHPGLLALVKLENAGKRRDTFIAGTQNFYVITRYNWSSYYALAVIKLGEAVQRKMPKTPKYDNALN